METCFESIPCVVILVSLSKGKEVSPCSKLGLQAVFRYGHHATTPIAHQLTFHVTDVTDVRSLLNNYQQKHIVKLKRCACAKDFKTTCSFSQIHSCLLYANTLIPYHFCSSVSTKGKRNQWLCRWKIQNAAGAQSAGVKSVWQIWSFQNHQAFRTCDFVWLHQRPSDLTTPTTVVVWVAEVGKR